MLLSFPALAADLTNGQRQTVVRMAVGKDVTTEAAESAMIVKAKEIGLKKVAQQKVSQLPTEVVETAIRMNWQMLDVMNACATSKP